jgi:hypothetical protein
MTQHLYILIKSGVVVKLQVYYWVKANVSIIQFLDGFNYGFNGQTVIKICPNIKGVIDILLLLMIYLIL